MKRALLLATTLITFAVVAADAASVPRKLASTEGQRTTVTDTVKKVREDDEGLVVLFQKNAGTYYLRRDVAEFDAIRKKLEASLNEKKPVSVTVESSQLNILEVK